MREPGAPLHVAAPRGTRGPLGERLAERLPDLDLHLVVARGG
jgi:hypothetical protein